MDTLYLTCLLFLLQYTTILVRGAPCSGRSGSKVFGPDCKYLCHCKDSWEQCDVTGSCRSGCADKWMGPGCQYRDIAFGKKTNVSKGIHSSNRVNDGRTDTCTSTYEYTGVRDESAWWGVFFPKRKMIQGLEIITKQNELSFSSGFSVYVYTSDTPPSREVCYQHDGKTTLKTPMTVVCGRALTGNQVRIQLAENQHQLVLCDVRIFGGRNLAYLQPTSQSSTHDSRYNSSEAVDGSEQTYTYTKSGPQWWRVDFDTPVHVKLIRLHSRDSFRQTDTLHIGNESISFQNLDVGRNPMFITTDTICQFVMFERQQSYVTLYEVNVFGDCPENKCGLDCSIPCHCVDFTFDNKISGTCHEGCMAGWTGVDGKCDTESTTSVLSSSSTCVLDRWGPACSKPCHCINSESCDQATGNCPYGCKDGYKATRTCGEACVDWTYGPGCSGQCSGHCLDSDICDKVDGHCPQECAAGWTGERCDKECVDETYGPNCSGQCSGHCLDNDVCEKVDGHCPRGCAPGWTGKKCDKECDDGTFGSQCNKACSIHCVGNVCDKVTGHCSAGCSPGWRGDNCTAACPTGKYGTGCSQNCSSHCWTRGRCNATDGRCSHCRPGWTGDRCDEECDDGTFGSRCTKACSIHCVGNVCDKVTGHCSAGCSPGWRGDNCTAECLDESYGDNCSGRCSGHCLNNGVCDKVTGTCPRGCSAGWTGDTCDKGCRTGTYGLNCSQACSTQCMDSGQCDKVTGHCKSCKPGWTGGRCDTVCRNGEYGDNCAGRCSGHCLNNGMCDKITGYCPSGCSAGWMGDRCDSGCQKGKYGASCSRICSTHCKNSGECDNVNGHCKPCRPGWTGDRCNKGCQTGKYGSKCSKTCSTHCTNSGQCDKVNGHCKPCRPGWTGDRCDTACRDGSFGNNCYGRCSGHCMNNGVCDKVTGSCPRGCSAGWTGDRCDRGCQTGKYGLKCSRTCSTNCRNSGQCNKENGNCKPCRPGWTGDRCDTVCPIGRYGDNCSGMCSRHCLNNGVCDKITGYCPRGCSAGWMGYRCNSGCQTGKYGLTCSRSCSTNCRNSGQCNKVNGHCKPCKPGWTGDRCDIECKSGTFGLECREVCRCRNNRACNKITGRCLGGCAAGWTGNKCGSACPAGSYGVNCSNNCSRHCWHGQTCDKVNGHCNACLHGWMGGRCDQECPTGKYGYHCHHNCSGKCIDNQPCNKSSGTCVQGCISGWMGDKCDRECKSWSYGAGCSGQCSGNCKRNEVCNKVDGRCPNGCAPGWREGKCDKECVDWTYGSGCSGKCSGHCLENDVCDKANGHCQRGCAAGWTGKRCDKECPDGKYGLKCEHTCSRHCLTQEPCSKSNGKCKDGCKPGWSGDGCLSRCKDGFYGSACTKHCSGHCLNDAVCDKRDGRCSSGCSPGWKGERCDIDCPDGTYGRDCTHTCSGHCLHGDPCNRYSGVCDVKCEPGWNGDLCDEECLNGTYGPECMFNCSDHCLVDGYCQKTDGRCTDGCEAGWQGDTCDVVVSLSESRSPIASPVAGGIAGVLIVIAMLILILVLVYRRRKQTSGSKQESNGSQRSDEARPPPQDHVYGNSLAAARRLDNVPEGRHLVTNGEERVVDDTAPNVLDDPHACEYYNMSDFHPCPLPLPKHGIYVSHLQDVLSKQANNPAMLVAEFKDIPMFYGHPILEATKSSNKAKNRYQKMYPYDHNRVVLDPKVDDPYSDYINASFINGYKRDHAYVAAQGPTKVTIGDFWRLIWQRRIQTIVIVTTLFEQGKVKCEQYWDTSGPKKFGDITVTVVSEKQFAEFTVRTFKAKSARVKRQLLVHQYHYTAWPDKSCPDGTASLLNFWSKVNKDNPKADTPWLVHCSAGVGRTGTFIALDILIAQGRDTGFVDVYGSVEELRQQRVYMVQTQEQYIYLHDMLVDALVLQSLPVPTNGFLDMVKRGNFDDFVNRTWTRLQERESVSRTTLYDSLKAAVDVMPVGKKPENLSMNRYETMIPADQYRPFLATVDNSTNYINAVVMPSYQRQKGFILTQTPLPTTTIDWWRLVDEQNISVVVAFEDAGTEEVGAYLPTEHDCQIGPFHVRVVASTVETGYSATRYDTSYMGKSRELTHIQYRNWPRDAVVPTDMTSVLQLCQGIQELHGDVQDTPILIQCRDGATRSGLMAVLLSALERLRVEEEVAVLQILRHLRIRRPQILPNKDQFAFCYDAIRHHIEDTCTYMNM